MRFSARGEYGLLALIELALHNGAHPIQARTIAKNQKIPLRFLEQVLSALKRAGLVESIRGAQGGYHLGRMPEEITIGDILEAIEGPLPSPGCMAGGVERCWHEIELGYCIVKETRNSVRNSILESLNGTNLQDLCGRLRQNEQNKVLMYHI